MWAVGKDAARGKQARRVDFFAVPNFEKKVGHFPPAYF